MNPISQNNPNFAKLDEKYSNYFVVGHNSFEFLIDFGHCSPEDENEHFHTRIITSPNCAKALFELFRESIDQYESTFGVIRNL